jgi:ABC-type dipeptide/oligopeptide/nickel transport system permease component
VVTVVGLQFGRLLGGTVVVESIFAWPGLGRLMIDAVGQRDYPLVQAVLLIMVMMFVLINLLMDLMYGLIDPRIRLSRGRG